VETCCGRAGSGGQWYPDDRGHARDCPVHGGLVRCRSLDCPPSLKHEVEAPESSTTVTAAEAGCDFWKSAVWV